MSTWPIIGGVIGGLITVIGYFLVAKRQRQWGKEDEKLKEHFDNLASGIIDPIIDTIDNLNFHARQGRFGTSSMGIGAIDYISFPQSFNFEESELFKGFKAHYLEAASIWRKLEEKSTELNRNAEAFENKVEETVKLSTDLPLKEFNVVEEMIIDHTPKLLCQTLWQIVQGQAPNYDFSNAKIEPIDSLYVLKFDVILGISHLIYTSTFKKGKECKSILVGVQESLEFRGEAFKITEDARKIKSKFEDLKDELNHIKSRGLISKDSKYRFKAVRKCPICKELFF